VTWQIAVAAAAVAAGALVQGSIGFGFALVSAPVIGLVVPAALPGSLLLLALPLNAVMIRREWRSAHLSGFGMLVVGLGIGTPLGALALRAAPADLLGALFGAAIVMAAAASLLAPAIEPTPGAQLAAGLLSGAINTVAATGGPPIALLYQRRPGPVLRATLAMTFAVASVFAIAAIVVFGEFGRSDWLLAAWGLPGLLAGLLASRPLARYLDERWLRPAVIAFAGVAGIAAMIRALV